MGLCIPKVRATIDPYSNKDLEISPHFIVSQPS